MNYQERVSTVGDLRGLYQRVLSDTHIEKYRGYTNTHYYGWDPETDEPKKIHRDNQDIWFDNPSYVKPPFTEAEIIEGIEHCFGDGCACGGICPYYKLTNCSARLTEDIRKLIADKNARIKELSGDTELE